MSQQPFLTDIKVLRERARRHIEQGAVTEGYQADRETVVKIGDKDTTTRRMFEEILAVEEEHADDLVSLLGGMSHPWIPAIPAGSETALASAIYAISP